MLVGVAATLDCAAVLVRSKGVWVPVGVLSDTHVVVGAGLSSVATDVSCVAAVRPAVDEVIPAVSAVTFGFIVTDVDEFWGRDSDAEEEAVSPSSSSSHAVVLVENW